MNESCANCRFSKDLWGIEGGLYLCRRNPPVNNAQFPTVGSKEWCGEYKEKPKAGDPKKIPTLNPQ